MAFLTTIIPVYNGERYLSETLEALAKQTVKPDRVVIQDNCSTDGTRQVYEAFKHLGFEWRQNPSHVDVVDNFNNAFAYANQTEYLHILCSDDLVLPRLFEHLVPPLESCTGPALAYSAFAVVDEQSRIMADGGGLECHVPVTKTGEPYVIPVEDYLRRQAELYTVMMPAAILKTCRQPIAFGFEREFIASDAVFLAHWGRLCERIVEVPQVLCHYRRHPLSATSRVFKTPGVVVEDEWKCINNITNLIPMSRWQRWLRSERNRCLLSARSHAKIKLLAKHGPSVRSEIEDTTRKYVSPMHWVAGGWAVTLRDWVRRVQTPKSSTSRIRLV